MDKISNIMKIYEILKPELDCYLKDLINKRLEATKLAEENNSIEKRSIDIKEIESRINEWKKLLEQKRLYKDRINLLLKKAPESHKIKLQEISSKLNTESNKINNAIMELESSIKSILYRK